MNWFLNWSLTLATKVWLPNELIFKLVSN